ncbi:MAG: hypothetical protein Q8P18_14860 [Pseudomonadota bacterium]|nr:hypothetical protein [Pseudomonadota bacterium]
MYLPALLAGGLAYAADLPPPTPVTSEVPTESHDELAELKARIAALEAAQAKAEQDAFLRDAESLAGEAPLPSESGAPSLFPMNPGITAFADIVGQVGVHDGAITPGSTMYVRSLELDIRAAVDPFAKAAVVLAFEQEAPPLDGSAPSEGFGAEPEEAYIDLVALPWHLSGRVGKFKQPFGLMNRTHPHDLPWTDAPAALDLLAEEGYNDTGGTLSWVVPVGPVGITVTGGALSGEPFEEAGPNAGLAGLGRVEVFGGFGSVDVGVGASAVHHFGLGAQALGGDFSFRYRPSTRRSVVVLAELLRSMEGELGGYAALQVQPGRSVYLGFREDFDAAGPVKHNLFLSYYTSEFLRLRIGGGYDPAAQAVDALAQLTFVWGSHPSEPWWVNK